MSADELVAIAKKGIAESLAEGSRNTFRRLVERGVIDEQGKVLLGNRERREETPTNTSSESTEQ